MKNLRKTTAAASVSALVAAPLAFALASSPATAQGVDGPERTKYFSVAGAEAEFSVEKEHGQFEVSADVDRANPGSHWKITLRHGGKVIYKKKLTADLEGDVDVTRTSNDTRGGDTFKVIIKHGDVSKSRTIKMR